MPLLDTLSLIGEIIAWIGLGLGLCCALIAHQQKKNAEHWTPVDVLVFIKDNHYWLRWLTPQAMFERRLSFEERRRMDLGWHTVLVHQKDGARLRYNDPTHSLEIFTMLAKILLIAGVLGFAASWLSIFG